MSNNTKKKYNPAQSGRTKKNQVRDSEFYRIRNNERKIIRVQKYMAECGVASRRAAEELIAKGKVSINGHVATLGDKVDPNHDSVTVRGKKISRIENKHYIMLNKPRGYVTTVNDRHAKKKRLWS